MEAPSPAHPQSPLIQFYLGEKADTEGRFLRDIREWNSSRLEMIHDYIQWLFPTRQRSKFNADAPEVGPEEVRAFREDRRLRAELVVSLRQMLTFYGFAYQEDSGGRPIIEPGKDWTNRREAWLHPGNHNLLRITRILDCLSTFGLHEHAHAFLRALDGVNAATPGAVPARTLDFWRKAAGEI